ncbi:MAG: hypothetical protein KJP04_10685 [Arenicella sp.]|nr:hypothetical protein [Arenicella sp.]
MSREAWIYAKPAAWASIAPAEGESPEWQYSYDNAISGFWNDYTGGFRVYNVPGIAVQSLVDALEAAQPGSVAHTFAWEYPAGTDSLDDFPTDPTPILAVMKDHKEYDIDGNEISSTPPTLETPNWGHRFAGQQDRIFAGGFSAGFSKGFK